MYTGLGQPTVPQGPIYRFLLPREWRPDAPQSPGEPAVDSGANYPGCSRDDPDAAKPGSPCRPQAFQSLADGERYARDHGEIPVIVSSTDEAWAVVERGSIGGNVDANGAGQPTSQTPDGTIVLGYPPGSVAPFTDGSCETGYRLYGSGPTAYCVPPPASAAVAPQQTMETVATTDAGSDAPVLSVPTVAVSSGGGGGGGYSATGGGPVEDDDGPVMEAGFSFPGGDTGIIIASIVGVFLLQSYRLDKQRR